MFGWLVEQGRRGMRVRDRTERGERETGEEEEIRQRRTGRGNEMDGATAQDWRLDWLGADWDRLGQAWCAWTNRRGWTVRPTPHTKTTLATPSHPYHLQYQVATQTTRPPRPPPPTAHLSAPQRHRAYRSSTGLQGLQRVCSVGTHRPATRRHCEWVVPASLRRTVCVPQSAAASRCFRIRSTVCLGSLALIWHCCVLHLTQARSFPTRKADQTDVLCLDQGRELHVGC